MVGPIWPIEMPNEMFRGRTHSSFPVKSTVYPSLQFVVASQNKWYLLWLWHTELSTVQVVSYAALGLWFYLFDYFVIDFEDIVFVCGDDAPVNNRTFSLFFFFFTRENGDFMFILQPIYRDISWLAANRFSASRVDIVQRWQ